MGQAFVLCWQPSELGTAVANRKEGLLYLGTGAFFALCNPGGTKFGGLLLNTLPENTTVYLCGISPRLYRSRSRNGVCTVSLTFWSKMLWSMVILTHA